MTAHLPRWRLLLAVILLMAAAIGLTAISEIRRQSGTEYVLEIEPYDPRDMFFGHYAVINFKQEIAEFPEEWNVSRGRNPWFTFPEGAKAIISFDTLEIVVTGYLGPGQTHKGPEIVVPMPARRSERGFRLADRLLALPDRYYADEVTALALEKAIRSARRRQEEPAPIYAIISYKSPQDIRLKGLIIEGQEYRDRLWSKPAITAAFTSAPEE